MSNSIFINHFCTHRFSVQHNSLNTVNLGCIEDLWSFEPYLRPSRLPQADRQSQSRLQMLCTASSPTFTPPVTPTPIPSQPQTAPPPPLPLSPGGSSYHFNPAFFVIFSLFTLIDSPTETAPYGSARGRRQHGPLQLHPHGFDPHSTGHQDRQGCGRFGITLTSLAPDFTCFPLLCIPL